MAHDRSGAKSHAKPQKGAQPPETQAQGEALWLTPPPGMSRLQWQRKLAQRLGRKPPDRVDGVDGPSTADAEVAPTGVAGSAAAGAEPMPIEASPDGAGLVPPLHIATDGLDPHHAALLGAEEQAMADIAGAGSDEQAMLAGDMLQFLLDLAFLPEPGARHDFSDEQKTVIGEGDEVFKPMSSTQSAKAANVARAFPATPEGVVQAAFYELHRGEARPLAEILADPTQAKLQRGPAAPTEGDAKLNDDTKAPAVGKADKAQGMDLRGTYATETKLAELRKKHGAELSRLAELEERIRPFVAKRKEAKLRPEVQAEVQALESERAALVKQLAADPEVQAIRAAEKQVVSQPAGHVRSPGQAAKGEAGESVGGVRAALMVGADFDAKKAKEGKEQQYWCGSFVAYVYARCGIDVGKGFASAFKAPRQLSTEPGAEAFMRPPVRAKDGEKMKEPKKPKKPPYFASHQLAQVEPHEGDADSVADISPKFAPINLAGAGARAIDIRPGDVAWTMHDVSAGHVFLIVGVEHTDTGVYVVTIEGNLGQKVNTAAHRLEWKDGNLTGDIVGWGRPPEFAALPAGCDTADPAMMAYIEKYRARLNHGQQVEESTQ